LCAHHQESGKEFMKEEGNRVAQTESLQAGKSLGKWDVIVVGGGTAGVCAAIASARHGARTLLVEQFGFLGGTQAGALVGPVAPNYLADGTPLTLGIGQEIWDRMAALGAAGKRREGRYGPREWPWFDHEMLKCVLDDMVTEAGVEVLFHTWLSAAEVKAGRIDHLAVENKSGRLALQAECYVDATGDADVAYRAGVPCESGRPSDGLNQPASLRFTLGNVDWERAARFLREQGLTHVELPTVSYAEGGGAKELESLIKKAIADGCVSAETMRYFQFFALDGRPGEVTFNCPELRLKDPCDAFELSRALVEGRRRIRELIRFCRKYLVGFENCYLVSIAPMLGVRSSRRIRGRVTLTAEDVLSGRKFPDAVARNNWPPDIHSPREGEGLVLEEKKMKLAPGDYCDIPYGCLVPEGVTNLLVAGRCISATFEAQAAIRISRVCQALGQAAGTAAALCAIGGYRTDELDGRIVHETLARDGLFA